ncbi:MAG TPA: metallophosphoesterase [Polyangia bacterium]|nr:metallophosphoesterase [Polyangia bacterium]
MPAATRVREVEHTIDVGRSGRSPLRVAFASDLHVGPLTPPRLLDEAFDRLARWRPDVLALGGDYVSLDVTPAMAARLSSLVARVPAAIKVGVLGNHDLWTDHGLIERALADAGVRVLVNESFALPAPHDDVAFVGLDDPWSGEPDPARAFAGVTAPVRLGVVHAPEGQPFATGRGLALLMCGHTHGGQVALPSGPVVVHGPLGRRWPGGLYDVDDLKLYVSRGLGTVDLPLRLYAPAEVALFTIT